MTSPQTMNPYAYAHHQPTRFTDPSGRWVDEQGNRHPCTLMTETEACLGQIPDWFRSNDMHKAKLFLKGAGKSIVNSLDPMNLVRLHESWNRDPFGTRVGVIRSPFDMTNGLLDSFRNCDYEAMGELTSDIMFTLSGGASMGGVITGIPLGPRYRVRPGKSYPPKGLWPEVRTLIKEDGTLPPGEYIFAVDAQFNMYLAKDRATLFSPDGSTYSANHGALRGGENAYGAGEVVIGENGKVVSIEDATGHYYHGRGEFVGAFSAIDYVDIPKRIFQDLGLWTSESKLISHSTKRIIPE